jgi:hypothetical protein
MITVLGLNRQNRTTGISEISLDMRNMPKSDASGTSRHLAALRNLVAIGA